MIDQTPYKLQNSKKSQISNQGIEKDKETVFDPEISTIKRMGGDMTANIQNENFEFCSNSKKGVSPLIILRELVLLFLGVVFRSSNKKLLHLYSYLDT